MNNTYRKMSDKQHAQLVLRGSDISAVENNAGFITTDKIFNLTWKTLI